MNIATNYAGPSRDPRRLGAHFPALQEMRVRVRHGIIEFPVHHVCGGTSTGLVIWERFLPSELLLQEELLRHCDCGRQEHSQRARFVRQFAIHEIGNAQCMDRRPTANGEACQ